MINKVTPTVHFHSSRGVPTVWMEETYVQILLLSFLRIGGLLKLFQFLISSYSKIGIITTFSVFCLGWFIYIFFEIKDNTYKAIITQGLEKLQ